MIKKELIPKYHGAALARDLETAETLDVSKESSDENSSEDDEHKTEEMRKFRKR